MLHDVMSVNILDCIKKTYLVTEYTILYTVYVIPYAKNKITQLIKTISQFMTW